MRAARWVVIGTALVAAATAFHLLLSPGGGSRSGASSRDASSAGPSGSADRAPGGSLSGGASEEAGPPLDEIDAESREAMRNFLRESAQDGK